MGRDIGLPSGLEAIGVDATHYPDIVQGAAAARSIGTGGAYCCKSAHRVSPCPRARGAPEGASADDARGVRAEGRPRCTVCAMDAHGGRHLGPSLAPATVSPCRLGQFARRHYRLAPLRSGRAGSLALLALGPGCDAGWGRLGACRARCLTSISSLSAAGFQEMRPVRAPG